MKQFLTMIFIFLATLTQSQDILWEKSLGGKHSDYLMDVIATPDYGFLLAGSSLSGKSGNKTVVSNGDLDYWLWKMNENGDLDWQKTFGGSSNDFLYCVKLTSDGGYILGGTSNSTDFIDNKKQKGNKIEKCRGDDDFWIIKLNAAGVEEWQSTIGGFGQEKLKSIAQTKDGGYILGGSSASSASDDFEVGVPKGEKSESSYGNMDYWVVKLDKNAKIVWQKTIGGIYEDELRSIEATKDGGYIVGGYSNSPQSGNKTEDNKGNGDYWVLKLDQNGDIKWQKTIGGNQDDQLSVVHQTYDGNFIVGGNSNSEASNEKRSNNSNGTDFWILKLGQEGEILWQENYNIGEIDVLSSIVENKDHTLLMAGFAKGQIPLTPKGGIKDGSGDFVAIKITENGEEIWRQSVGSDGEDLLKKVIETRDGGYLLAGTSSPVILNSRENPSSSKNDKLGIQQTENQQLQKATVEVNQAIKEVQNDINQDINKTISSLNPIKGEKQESSLNPSKGGKQELGSIKYGLNFPTDIIKLLTLGSDSSSTPPLGVGGPGTGDQAKVFGSNDFWVVKLRDKDKKVVPRIMVEAAPNPTEEFTNIVIGYDFVSGTATIADLAGHVLQQIDIKTRTVPIDLGQYPEGIYIVNIATNVSSDGVKVIKKGNKN